MKRLVIIRHAKSMHESYVAADVERHLAGRGYGDIEQSVDFLKGKKIHPDLIVTSPAIRAYSTALIVANRFGYAADKMQLNSSIYDASLNSLMYVVQGLDDKCDTVFLFGHNPGLTELINALCGFTLTNLPTSGVALIEFPFNHWNEVDFESGSCLGVYSGRRERSS